MPDELFELLAADDARPRRRAVVGEVGIDVVHGVARRAHQNGGGIHPLPGEVGVVELFFDEAADVLRLLLIGIDVGDELAVQVEQSEGKAHHLLLAVLCKVADLDALSAQVDEDGALERLIVEIGDIVAVRLGGAVDEVDGQPRLRKHLRGDFVVIFDVPQGGGGDEIAALHAQLRARFLEAEEHLRELLRTARRERALLQIVHEGEGGALLENDLRLVCVGSRHDHGNAARTDVDDRILHN